MWPIGQYPPPPLPPPSLPLGWDMTRVFTHSYNTLKGMGPRYNLLKSLSCIKNYGHDYRYP